MNPNNPYEKRWRWWYPAIADWMLANPGGTMAECAASIGKAHITISMIVTTDLFKSYFAQRRKEWTAMHDEALRDKLHKVANFGLDLMLESMEKKRDNVPFMKALPEVTMSALDRLGYSPNAPATQVNVSTSGPTQLNFPAIGVEQLEEARAALRRAERLREASPEPTNIVPRSLSGAAPPSPENDEEEGLDGALFISSQ